MTPKQLAAQIPSDYRREILLANMISKAQAIAGDNNMFYLFTVWKNYIDPDISDACNLCLASVLESYRNLQDVFIQLEKETKLLNEDSI